MSDTGKNESCLYFQSPKSLPRHCLVRFSNQPAKGTNTVRERSMMLAPWRCCKSNNGKPWKAVGWLSMLWSIHAGRRPLSLRELQVDLQILIWMNRQSESNFRMVLVNFSKLLFLLVLLLIVSKICLVYPKLAFISLSSQEGPWTPTLSPLPPKCWTYQAQFMWC